MFMYWKTTCPLRLPFWSPSTGFYRQVLPLFYGINPWPISLSSMCFYQSVFPLQELSTLTIPSLQIQYYGSSHGYCPKFLIWSQLVFVMHSRIMYSVAFNYPTPSLQLSKILSFGVLPLKCRNFVYLTPETAHILFFWKQFFSSLPSLSRSHFPSLVGVKLGGWPVIAMVS